VHLHVPQVPQHLFEELYVFLHLRDLMLSGEKVQEGAEVRWGPRIIPFGDLISNDSIEGVNV
jgi:hypothetical protein